MILDEGGLRTKGNLRNSNDINPLVSIVTVVLNGEKYLESTIQSIVDQSYENMEYIIVDGGSTDQTISIIKKYENKIDYWVSEKDKGISDAFNKGVKYAKGDYINFQGDGDGFVTPNALERVFHDIKPHHNVFVSARIQRIDIDGNEIYTTKYIPNFDKRSLLFRMSLPHQGLFTHKSYFEKYKFFDDSYTFCMDYDHLLRSYQEFPEVITKDVVVAKWREDGIGNGRTPEILDEYDKTKKKNKVASAPVLLIIKYIILLKYYLKILFIRDKNV